MRAAAAVAAISFAASVAGFGAALEGYSQVAHPVALLGARGMPHALAFNALGFVLPGLLATVVAWCLRMRMQDDAGWALRIGARLVLLSALAFAAQGVLPLDPGDLESPASRAHATAWMLWWVALAPAALLLASGLRRDRTRRLPALSCAALAVAVLCLAALPLHLLAPAVAQRALFAAWLGWVLLVVADMEVGVTSPDGH